MSQTPPPEPLPAPSRQDLLRPIEMLGGAAIGSVFVGLVVLMVTRELELSAIAFGAVFVIVLVALAMFAITMKPNAAEVDEIAEENGETPSRGHWAGGSGHWAGGSSSISSSARPM